MDSTALMAHKPQLLSYAIKTTNRNIAEDLVQDTFVKAIRFEHTFDGYNLGGWLMQILKSRVADYYRQRDTRPQQVVEISDMEKEGWADSEPQWIDHYNLGVFGESNLDEAVKLLSQDFQEVIVLKYVYGLGDKEIATIQQVAVNTIATRHKRALEKLREIVKDWEVK